MRIKEDELFKIKEEFQKDFTNKVYSVSAGSYYEGTAEVIAIDSVTANIEIESFKKHDIRNYSNSKGFCSVSEGDFTGYYTDETKGVDRNDIVYRG